MATAKRILFAGSAPVHFVCFRPIFEALRDRPDVDVVLTGGRKTDTGADLRALYAPFGVPQACLMEESVAQHERFDLVVGANTTPFRCRSAGAHVLIFHGASFRNRAVRETSLDYDFLLLLGPYMRRLYATRGLLPEGDSRAVPIGFPKTDRLVDGSLDASATLRAHGLQGDRPTVLYAPTGQLRNSFETMGLRVIENLARSNRVNLIIKLHDHPKRTDVPWQLALDPLLGTHVKLSREPDVIPLLHAADVLITDASSVSSEFSLLDRPMVFLDVPEILEANREGGLDLETWGRRAGDLVADPDQIVQAVDLALTFPARHSALRRAMASDLFYHPGRATRAAVSWMEQRLGLPGSASRNDSIQPTAAAYPAHTSLSS